MSRRTPSELELKPEKNVKSALKFIYDQGVGQKFPDKKGLAQILALVKKDNWKHLDTESNLVELQKCFVPLVGILNQQKVYNHLSEMLDEDDDINEGEKVRKAGVIKVIYDILSLFKVGESFSAAYVPRSDSLIFYKS